jgi:hypothetical protein
MHVSLALLLSFLLGNFAYGQSSNFNNLSRNWSKNKKEFMFGGGGSNFLGDLGGRDQIGTDYSLVDFDLPSVSFDLFVGFRYRYKPRFATTTMINYGRLKGDDRLTKDMIRRSRNLHFRSPILSVSQRFEWIVYANEQIGGRYRIPGIKRMPDRNNQFYLFGGLGLAWFNPKALYNNNWIALRPLSTEGQGLAGGIDEVKPWTFIIPVGAGFRVALNKTWRIGIEAIYTKTFSDYIDDVAGVYFSPAQLKSNVGADAAYLSNPAYENQFWYTPGQQRGDDELDAYLYLNLALYYNFTYKVFDGKFSGAPKYRGRSTKYRGGGRRYKF